MQGNVRKRGNTWSYQFFLGVVDGKKKYKSKGGFNTKGEASKALAQALCDYQNGGYIEPKKITLSEVSLKWLNDYVKPLRKISTYNRYKELVDNYLIPYMGNMNIIDIKPLNIDHMLLRIKEEHNISGSTLQSIYTILNTIMNKSILWRLIKDNPCKYVERPKRDKFVSDTLDQRDIHAIFSNLDLDKENDFIFFIGLRIVLELGLRRGELCGLEWNDIRFNESTIRVINNMTYSNGHVYVGSLKTDDSYRTIPVSNDLLTLLSQLKEKQFNSIETYGKFYIKNIFNDREYDFVLRWSDGKYVHPMYFTNKLPKMLKQCGINKKIRFHDSRHTNATLLLQKNTDLKTIQQRLGHGDIRTTMNIYSHVTNEMQIKATNTMSEILKF